MALRLITRRKQKKAPARDSIWGQTKCNLISVPSAVDLTVALYINYVIVRVIDSAVNNGTR